MFQLNRLLIASFLAVAFASPEGHAVKLFGRCPLFARSSKTTAGSADERAALTRTARHHTDEHVTKLVGRAIDMGEKAPGLTADETQNLLLRLSEYGGSLRVQDLDSHLVEFRIDSSGRPHIVLFVDPFNRGLIAHELDHFEVWEELLALARQHVDATDSAAAFEEASHRAWSAMFASSDTFLKIETRAVDAERPFFEELRLSAIENESLLGWQRRTGTNLNISELKFLDEGRLPFLRLHSSDIPAIVGVELYIHQRNLYARLATLRDLFERRVRHLIAQKRNYENEIQNLRHKNHGVIGFLTQPLRASQIKDLEEEASEYDRALNDVNNEAKNHLRLLIDNAEASRAEALQRLKAIKNSQIQEFIRISENEPHFLISGLFAEPTLQRAIQSNPTHQRFEPFFPWLRRLYDGLGPNKGNH